MRKVQEKTVVRGANFLYNRKSKVALKAKSS